MQKTNATPATPKKKLVLSRDTVRSLNDPITAEAAATGCNCYSRCTCTTDLC